MQKSYIWHSYSTDLRAPDTIHHILAFGTLADIRHLKQTVGEKEVKKVFLQNPKKIYSRPSLNFITKFILHISSPFYEDHYLKYTPRDLR